MIAAANPVQVAAHTLLLADTGSGGLFETGDPILTGVYDEAGIPDGATYPYVAYGDMAAGRWDTFSRDGETMDFIIHVWTQQRGYKQAMEITTRLKAILGNVNLSATGFSLAKCLFARYSRVHDPKDDIEHIVVVFDLWLQET